MLSPYELLRLSYALDTQSYKMQKEDRGYSLRGGM